MEVGPDAETRRARLHEPHVRPLAALAERLRAVHGADRVCDPDPCEAGVGARILLLMESPGPRAAPARGGSGFVSVDNASPTSRTLRALHDAAGIDRAREVLTWNAVPWWVGDGTRIRTPTRAHRRAAAAPTRELLQLLPRLTTVVLLGRVAALHWAELGEPRDALRAPHPSPQNLAARPHARDELLAALVQAARSSGQVRQVGPPSPLRESSDPS